MAQWVFSRHSKEKGLSGRRHVIYPGVEVLQSLSERLRMVRFEWNGRGPGQRPDLEGQRT